MMSETTTTTLPRQRVHDDVVVRVLGERPFAIFEGCIEIGQDHPGHDPGGVVAEVSEVEENDRILVEDIPKVELVLGIIEDLAQVGILRDVGESISDTAHHVREGVRI